MNKRKTLLLALAACMIAILAVGGTLAYFTAEETVTEETVAETEETVPATEETVVPEETEAAA